MMYYLSLLFRALAVLAGIGLAGAFVKSAYVHTLYDPERYGQYVHASEQAAFLMALFGALTIVLIVLAFVTNWIDEEFCE